MGAKELAAFLPRACLLGSEGRVKGDADPRTREETRTYGCQGGKAWG